MHCYSFIDDKMLTEDCYVVALPHMRLYDFFIFIYKCNVQVQETISHKIRQVLITKHYKNLYFQLSENL